jgi:hypothetical protein
MQITSEPLTFHLRTNDPSFEMNKNLDFRTQREYFA